MKATVAFAAACLGALNVIFTIVALGAPGWFAAGELAIGIWIDGG